MWLECSKKDPQGDSCWLHPREIGPRPVKWHNYITDLAWSSLGVEPQQNCRRLLFVVRYWDPSGAAVSQLFNEKRRILNCIEKFRESFFTDVVSRNETVRRSPFRRWNAKCVFLWNVTKVQKFALPSSGKRVSARVSRVLVPDLSNYAVFIAIHDAYHGFGSAIIAYSYTDRQPMARKYDICLEKLWNTIKIIPTWKIKQ